MGVLEGASHGAYWHALSCAFPQACHAHSTCPPLCRFDEDGGGSLSYTEFLEHVLKLPPDSMTRKAVQGEDVRPSSAELLQKARGGPTRPTPAPLLGHMPPGSSLPPSACLPGAQMDIRCDVCHGVQVTENVKHM